MTSVAPSVLQVRVADWPRSMDVGFADKLAVTGLTSGGGVFTTGGFGFFAQPLIIISNANVPRTKIQFLLLFTSFLQKNASLCPPRSNTKTRRMFILKFSKAVSSNNLRFYTA